MHGHTCVWGGEGAVEHSGKLEDNLRTFLSMHTLEKELRTSGLNASTVTHGAVSYLKNYYLEVVFIQ